MGNHVRSAFDSVRGCWMGPVNQLTRLVAVPHLGAVSVQAADARPTGVSDAAFHARLRCDKHTQ
jgi:hypothetical protein